MKVTYHVATSSDGFIARKDGDVSWLEDVEIDMSETGLEEFFAEVDGLVMGRYSYDFVFEFGSWPYEDKLTWVCTGSELNVLEGANLRVKDSVEKVIEESVSIGFEHLWLVGGGKLASSFVEKKYLTNIFVSEMPVELGQGIPLFDRHQRNDLDIESEVISEKNGFRQIDISLA